MCNIFFIQHTRLFLHSIRQVKDSAIMRLMVIMALIFSWTRATETRQFHFDKQLLNWQQVRGYDQLRYTGLELLQQPGYPQIPFKIVQFPVPAGQRLDSISVIRVSSQELPGEYDLPPASPPQVLSDPSIPRPLKKNSVYSGSTPFPAEVAQIKSAGSIAGQQIAGICLYPVQYFPEQRRVRFISEMTLSFFYASMDTLAKTKERSRYAQSIINKNLRSITTQELAAESPLFKPGDGSFLVAPETHPYVIITSEQLFDSFQPLRDWKYQKGLGARIVTTEWIYNQYPDPGIDNQTQIRNFIIDAAQNWQTLWFLLGGDTNIIPDRKVFAFDCEYGDYNDNYIPCDLYYADLDGDWNANGNSIYGEITDNVDMYADVFVGRAPVENGIEATAWVNKQLNYEKEPPDNHALNMLFLAMALWHNPYTNAGESKDYIDNHYVPARFDPITKLYEALGNENRSSVLAAMNPGQNIINHNGHAWYGGLSVGEGYISRNDMMALENENRYSLLYSIGCWPAAFDKDCVAEHFLTNPAGGGVAFVGNSRYGWGSPGNPLYGYSDRFDHQFFKQLFTEEIQHTGTALATAKARYVPLSQAENVYRWCEYEINLLGDPEMPVWTDEPNTLQLVFPGQLSFGENAFTVHTTNIQGQPLKDVMLCVMRDSTLYQTRQTGLNGTAAFNLTLEQSVSPLILTATKHNYIPRIDTVMVASDKPLVTIKSFQPRKLNPGHFYGTDTLTVSVELKNWGNDTAVAPQLQWQALTSNVTVVDTQASINSIAPQESLNLTATLTLRKAASLANGDDIRLKVVITDENGYQWQDRVVLSYQTPGLTYADHITSETTESNANGFADPGETVLLYLVSKNQGLASADYWNLELDTQHHALSFPSYHKQTRDSLGPGDCDTAAIYLNIDVECQPQTFPEIQYRYQDQYGRYSSGSFQISVGQFGFADDMETNDNQWHHTGSPDQWHRSTLRHHSGDYAWYCGLEPQRNYHINTQDNSLASEAFITGQAPQLSFWAWYEFPNYGTTGFYVETICEQDSQWQTLDFIGSGGALDMLPTGNDWLKYTYDLAQYSPGTVMQVRFRFQSDDEAVTEGVYIDDVQVYEHSQQMISGGFPQPAQLPDKFRILPNYPNPFNISTTIPFYLPGASRISVHVLNINGKLVDVLLNKELFGPGYHHIDWSAQQFSSGVYFYRISTPEANKTGKCLLLK